MTHPLAGKVATGIKIFFTASMSIAIQFGLAIMGWGGWRPFFTHTAMQALAWITAGLTVASVFSGSSVLISLRLGNKMANAVARIKHRTSR